VSTFDLIVQVVHDSKTYSSMSPHGGGLGLHQSAPADALIKEKGYGRSLPVFVNLDPPDHTVYRRTLERYSAFERARPQEQLHYNLSFVLRGLSALDLTLAKAPVASSPVKAGAPT
jgi:hypothetical protein